MGRGLQQIQRTCPKIFDQTLGHAVHTPQGLLRCKITLRSPRSRDLYVDAVSQAIASGRRLPEIVNNTAWDATPPTQKGTSTLRHRMDNPRASRRQNAGPRRHSASASGSRQEPDNGLHRLFDSENDYRHAGLNPPAHQPRYLRQLADYGDKRCVE